MTTKVRAPTVAESAAALKPQRGGGSMKRTSDSAKETRMKKATENQTRWVAPGKGSTFAELIEAAADSIAVGAVRQRTGLLAAFYRSGLEDRRTNLEFFGRVPLTEHDLERIHNASPAPGCAEAAGCSDIKI